MESDLYNKLRFLSIAQQALPHALVCVCMCMWESFYYEDEGE